MKIDKKAVEALSVEAGKAEKFLWDDEVPGFGARLRLGGAKTWIFKYRSGNQQRRVTLGAVSAVDLREARETASKLYARVKLGQDPAAEKVDARAEAAETFEAAMNLFLTRQRQRLRPRSYLEVERHLEIQSKIMHKQPLAKIDRRAVAALLTSLASKSGPSAANHCRSSLATFFGWAVKEGLIDVNPAIATNKAHVVGARERVLSDDELRDIWSALADDDYSDVVRLLTVTGARRDEIGSLAWSEIDLKNALVTLPAARVKNKRPFELPLNAPALAILQTRSRPDDRSLVFGRGQGGFSGWSKAKASLDQRIAEARKASGKPVMAPWVLHDLRRTMSTDMHDKLGILPHIVEACINHISGHKSGVAGTYNRAAYAKEKRQALSLWGDFVMAIAEGRDSNVIPFRA